MLYRRGLIIGFACLHDSACDFILSVEMAFHPVGRLGREVGDVHVVHGQVEQEGLLRRRGVLDYLCATPPGPATSRHVASRYN